MNKPIRDAVRCFLVKDDKVVCIKYLTKRVGYYDTPGGKIEKNESAVDTAKREFKEETGLDIINPKYRGIMYLEYPEQIFKFSIFISNEYTGEICMSDRNTVEFKDIKELLKEEKKHINVIILDDLFKDILLNSDKEFEMKIVADRLENLLELKFKYV